jgi:hypothetical protein
MSSFVPSFGRKAVTVAALSALALLGAGASRAQFAPPATVFGSVTDAAGPVAAGLPVEAFIGDLSCGKGKTEYTGDGDARVTVYWVDVSSQEDKPGCGSDGAEIRITIGDRAVDQVARWRAGPLQLDVVWGANVTPAPIPTFTPTPTRVPTTPQGGPNAQGTPVPGQDPGGQGSGSADASGSPTVFSGATVEGGVTTSRVQPAAASTSSDGGFPLWGIAIIAFAGVAAVGGGVGYAMSRRQAQPDDPFGGPPAS